MGKALSTHFIPGFNRRKPKDVPLLFELPVEQNGDFVAQKSAGVRSTKVKSTVVFPPNEDCPICLCECEDATPFECGHILHPECLQQQIASWSPEEKLSWIAISCPLCRQILEHSEIVNDSMRDIKLLKQKTDLVAFDSLKENVREILPGNHPSKKLKRMASTEKLELAYRKLAFYQCGKCLRPYCGGTISCSDAADQAFAGPGPAHENQILLEPALPVPVPEEEGNLNPVVESPEDEFQGDNELEEKMIVDVDVLIVGNADLLLAGNEQGKKETPSTSEETDDDYDVSYEEDLDLFAPKEYKLVEQLKLEPAEPEPEPEPEPGEENLSVEEAAPVVEGQPFKYMCLECLTNKPCGHPTNQLIYKCIKCCSVATFYCLGTEFYCDRCHSDLKTVYVCPGRKKCPLGISHPPNTVGTHGGGPPVAPFVVGCRICGIVSYSIDDQKPDQFVVDYY